MMITGPSLGTAVAFPAAGSRTPSSPAAEDQATLSVSASTFSSLVQEAGQMPDVRDALVDSFKSRVQSGSYPSTETLDGLVDKMGGAWSAWALADGPTGA